MPAAGVRTVSVSRREGDSGEPGGRPGGAECSGLEYLHVRIGSMQEERPLAPSVIRHLGLRRRCGVKCGPLLRMVSQRGRPDDERCDVSVSEPPGTSPLHVCVMCTFNAQSMARHPKVAEKQRLRRSHYAAYSVQLYGYSINQGALWRPPEPLWSSTCTTSSRGF